MKDEIHEECGVFGVSITTPEAVGITYNALLALQHRGQEGAGIAVSVNEGDTNVIQCQKALGLVTDVLREDELSKLPASKLAIGHTRYSTTGSSTSCNVQPFVTDYFTGRIAMVHNGNVTNALEIRNRLKKEGVTFSATSDSEVVASLIAYYTMKTKKSIEGVIEATKELKGAFSIAVISNNRLIAFRDSNGFRPLCLGKNDYGYAVASESCALETCGFKVIKDIQPGEVIAIENGQVIYDKVEFTEKDKNGGLCIFEYVYFARPDSTFDNLPVYDARINMGKLLAKRHPIDADIVCGVPDSGLVAAKGYSEESGIPLETCFVKNRYVFRSFIYPTQTQRDNVVKVKLNPIKSVVEGKRIVVVDDSIVRGTTTARIIKMLKEAGAKEVHMRVSAPPLKYSCHYGTDIEDEKNLIANKVAIEEHGQLIGSNSLEYISIEDLQEACSQCTLPFCTQCFTGDNKEDAQKKEYLERE